MEAGDALRLQVAMGYGQEDTTMIIESMAQVRRGRSRGDCVEKRGGGKEKGGCKRGLNGETLRLAVLCCASEWRQRSFLTGAAGWRLLAWAAEAGRSAAELGWPAFCLHIRAFNPPSLCFPAPSIPAPDRTLTPQLPNVN